ncbi:MAG: DUF4394 domain-containing protein [Thermoleophilaceae bacterium]|nr:DUF4394 domain-containing protein [Thermoleophilaceae bacterium]
MSITRRPATLLALTAAAFVAAPAGAGAAEQLAASDGERIGLFENSSVKKVKSLKVKGLRGAQEIAGLDVRPCTDELFAMAVANDRAQLYGVKLDRKDGEARLRSKGGRFEVDGDSFGFDFNPVVDRIRIVSGRGQNLRVSPGPAPAPCPQATVIPPAGTVLVDKPLNYADGAFPGRPRVTGVAYTNSVAGATTTQLLDIDGKTGNLFEQIPPNDGTLVDIGELEATPRGSVGFDIARNRGFASFTPKGKKRTESRLYSVALRTGDVRNLGEISKLKGPVTSLAALRKG